MGSILDEVLKATASAKLDEFQTTMSRVEGKMSTLKAELVDALQSCFILSDADIDRITSWSVEVNGIKAQVDDLLNGFRQEQDAFVTTSKEIGDVDERLLKSSQDITTLNRLVKIVEDLEEADESTTDVLEASIRLRRARNGIQEMMREFQSAEDQKWLQHLGYGIRDSITDVYHRILKDWNEKFRFKRNQLTIDNFGCNVITTVEALTNLEYLDRIWDRFLNQLWTEVVSKTCSPEYTVKISVPAGINTQNDATLDETFASFVSDSASVATIPLSQYAESGKSYWKIVVEKLETPMKEASEVFENIKNVVVVFATLFRDKPDLVASLGKALGPKVCNTLASKCLNTLILHNANGDVDSVRRDIQHLQKFIQSLKQLQFDIPPSDLESLEKFTNNFETLFREQLRQDICTRARELIRADVHKTVTLPPTSHPAKESTSPYLMKSPFTLHSQMEISMSIFDMVTMLQEHLGSYPDDVVLPEHTLNMYLAIVSVPVHESEASDVVPLRAAIIHNNCWYLAHHAGVSFKSCAHLIPSLRLKADSAFSFLMRSIRSKLNVMINAAMNGLDAKVESKIDCSKDFMRIAEELQRLNGIFKPVLPSYPWKRALALLVDHTVNDMVSKVLQWDDISANTASELASAFIKFAVEVSHLFKGESKSIKEIDALTSKLVKKWQRFRLLGFVLTASMTEIGDRWVGGCGPLAMEFTADEVRKLVRALFQNTDRRAAFLASIK